ISTAVENIALNTQTNNQAVKVAGNNIALSVLPLSLIPRGGVLENWGSDVTMLLNDSDKEPEERLEQFESFEVAVFLPENVLEKKRRNKETDMVIVVSRNSQFLKNVTVVSPVIDVVMGTEQVYDVDPPLKMIFKVQKGQGWKHFGSFWPNCCDAARGKSIPYARQGTIQSRRGAVRTGWSHEERG
ncbi:hypothetical protein AVEN_5108-1, partial [Araneus ventricosus]